MERFRTRGLASFGRASEGSNIARGTVSRAFIELQERGFIECMTKGGFNRKTPHASEWRLTWWSCDVLVGGNYQTARRRGPPSNRHRERAFNPVRRKSRVRSPTVRNPPHLTPRT